MLCCAGSGGEPHPWCKVVADFMLPLDGYLRESPPKREPSEVSTAWLSLLSFRTETMAAAGKR
jgi:hypothetical protein